VGTAFAQTGEGGGPPAIYNVGFLVVLIGIFYFLLIRPEQKRRREQDQLAANLKRNDQVVMSCGMHGRVAALADKLVTVEIAPNVRVQVDRAAIQSVQKAPATEPREQKEREKS
jgi:preprotein translocase subunit YajC